MKAVHRAGLVRPLQRDPPRLPRPAHRERSASCSTRSRPTCGPRSCSSSRSRSPRSCRASRRSCTRDQQAARAAGALAAASPRSCSSSSRKSCSRRTRSWRRRRSCSPSRRREVERKNREIEQAKLALEEKAEQLALTSKYKSEFLANMSHELRTPLNSLLILAAAARRERRGQPHRASRSSSPARSTPSGSDLLALINDILDLSKIESGTMAVDVGDVAVRRAARVRRAHLPPGGRRARASSFDIELGDDLPRVDLDRRASACSRCSRTCSPTPSSSPSRARSRCEIAPRRATAGAATTSASSRADAVVAFSVTDTGIGIPDDKQQHHLRGVPAGRRHHQPQVRRHRPRACRSAARSRACSAARSGSQSAAGRGQHLHALPAASTTCPMARSQSAPRGRRHLQPRRRRRGDRAASPAATAASRRDASHRRSSRRSPTTAADIQPGRPRRC